MPTPPQAPTRPSTPLHPPPPPHTHAPSRRRLLVHPGSFVPDIQRFVSGLESLAKRLAVIVLEDSYLPPDPPGGRRLLRPLLAALVRQRVPAWTPDRPFCAQMLRLGLSALAEPRCIAHAPVPEAYEPCTVCLRHRDAPYALSAALLQQLRSFAGDLAMFHSVAVTAPKWGQPVPRGPAGARAPRAPGAGARTALMPLEHCVDQHWAPDVVYFYDYALVRREATPGSAPFAGLFRRLFTEVTGVNPRRGADCRDLESQAFVAATRAAQRLYLFARQAAPTPRANAGSLGSFRYTLDRSWVAGLLGPLVCGCVRTCRTGIRVCPGA